MGGPTDTVVMSSTEQWRCLGRALPNSQLNARKSEDYSTTALDKRSGGVQVGAVAILCMACRKRVGKRPPRAVGHDLHMTPKVTGPNTGIP